VLLPPKFTKPHLVRRWIMMKNIGTEQTFEAESIFCRNRKHRLISDN